MINAFLFTFDKELASFLERIADAAVSGGADSCADRHRACLTVLALVQTDFGHFEVYWFKDQDSKK